MWKRTERGLTLTFHLAGINNQNFLMRDEQTGTFWQQISGRAVSGPLAGSQLELVYSDELAFRLWRAEAKSGTVLRPVAGDAKEYAERDWDVRMQKARTVLDFPNSGLRSRELVLGVNAFGAARAYPVERIRSAKLIEDRLGGEPILVVFGPDDKSIRVFRARMHAGDTVPDFYRLQDQPIYMDSATGSQWGFDGCAISGKAKGTCLEPIWAIKDYWFDWRNYHPDTTIFRR